LHAETIILVPSMIKTPFSSSGVKQILKQESMKYFKR